MTERRLLVTGGDGIVGRQVRPHLLAAGYRLRIFSREPVEALVVGEEAVVGTINDRGALRTALDGCVGVFHLAGCTTEAEWPDQIAGNIDGAVQLFEAARESGVRRVVFASSNHVVGMYPRDRRLGVAEVLRPDSRYAATKAFGELLGALFADKYGLEVLCVRIGSVTDRPIDERRLSLWCSPRDMAQLVVRGVETPGLHFQIVYGVSRNARSFYDNAAAAAVIGYSPLDSADDHAADIPSEAASHDPGAVLQGGQWAAVEFAGDLERIARSTAPDRSFS